MNESVPHDLRVQPKQARARKTVEHILDTAAALLEEVGVDGFNTNLLADRADVRVRTVYRYFPNKTAVILALGEKAVTEWDDWMLDEFGKLDSDSDWRVEIEGALRGLVQRVRDFPGQAAIRRAMRAIPELYVLEQEDNERLAEAYAQALRRIQPGLALSRARRVARCLVESAAVILDVALDQPPAGARGLIDELVEMQLAYVSTVFADRKSGD